MASIDIIGLGAMNIDHLYQVDEVVVDGEHLGSVGILGPTRMNYPQALATVDVVSEGLGHRLEEG